MAYDAEDTKRRIFEAATAEFAEHGLAGARIERIAAAAHANKQAIYLYFGGKEKLFGAVLGAKLAEIQEAVTIDPDAVGDSVGQLFDWYRSHPELIRLQLWEALELEADSAIVVDGEELDRCTGMGTKVDRLVAGGVAAHLAEHERTRAAQDLLFTIMGLIAWNFAVPRTCRIALDEETEAAALDRRRETVIATARLLARQEADRS